MEDQIPEEVSRAGEILQDPNSTAAEKSKAAETLSNYSHEND